jgi:hypothetical protein
MVTLNQYDGTFPVLGKQTVVAESLETAARVLNLQFSEDPVLIQRVKEGISVELPTTQTQFVTVVTPEEAQLAGNKSYPTAYTLTSGSKQIFTAEAVTGWHFVEWTINGSAVSSEPEALLTIPETVGILQIQAVFEADA